MTVLYYTQTYYLDAAIETIRAMQASELQLHLCIEITPDSRCTNIIHIKNLNDAKSLSDFSSLIGEQKAKAFEPYFKSLKSIHFVVYKQSSVFKLGTITTTIHFLKMLRIIKPNVIHFDTITLRSLFILPFILFLKKVITVHDPIAHIGETSWKTRLTKSIFFKLADHFIFYSNYAKRQFEYHYLNSTQPKSTIQFQPFTFNQQFIHTDRTPSCILFFGRISYYKGIDILLDAIPEILKLYPNQFFVIAGRSDGYNLDNHYFNKFKHNILLLNRYINSSEAVQLIQKSKFLVCPYRDASQSGVLMTARAIGKPVIATNVGAFSEYIEDGVNGLIAEPSKESIVEKILYLLAQNRFKDFENFIETSYSLNIADANKSTLLKAYSFN